MIRKAVVLVVVGLLISCGPLGVQVAQAHKAPGGSKTVTGVVGSVQPPDRLSVNGEDDLVLLRVDEQTRFQGVHRVGELRRGDVVKVRYEGELARSVALKQRSQEEDELPHIPCPKKP